MGEIGIGLWGASEWSECELSDILDIAISRGITLVDTAPVYGYLEAAEKALQDYSQIQISTKIPSTRSELQTLDAHYPLDHVARFSEKSFKNVGSRKINYLCLHNWDSDWSFNQDYLESIKEKSATYADNFGVSLPSDFSMDEMKQLLNLDVFDFYHIHYNLFRSENLPLIEMAKSSNKIVFVKSPLEHGLLTGSVFNQSESRFKSKSDSYIRSFREKVKRTYSADDCLNYCLESGADYVLVSFTKPDHFNI